MAAARYFWTPSDDPRPVVANHRFQFHVPCMSLSSFELEDESTQDSVLVESIIELSGADGGKRLGGTRFAADASSDKGGLNAGGFLR